MLYWTDSKWLDANNDNLPTLPNIWRDYRLVYEGNGWNENITPDDLFAAFNLEPMNYIKQLPEKVKHTSMSIGDMILIGNKAYICLPVGWKEINF